MILVVREGDQPSVEELSEATGKRVSLNEQTEEIYLFDCSHKGLPHKEESDILITVGTCQVAETPDLAIPAENAASMIADYLEHADLPGDEPGMGGID